MNKIFMLMIIMLFCILVNSSAEVVYYFNDFENTSDSLTEWSNKATNTAPGNGERFLGQFTTSTQLSIADLPTNGSIILNFDLYIIGTWDGQGPSAGPDTFGVKANGNELFAANFNNMEDATYGAQGQSFGGQENPIGQYAARTGAVATDTLLFPQANWGSRDSTYNLTFDISYNGSDMIINFYTVSGVVDEFGWGIDNIKISSSIPEPGTCILVMLFGLFVLCRKK